MRLVVFVWFCCLFVDLEDRIVGCLGFDLYLLSKRVAFNSRVDEETDPLIRDRQTKEKPGLVDSFNNFSRASVQAGQSKQSLSLSLDLYLFTSFWHSGFIQKVYSILSIQLLVMTLFAVWYMFEESTRKWIIDPNQLSFLI